MGYPLLLDCKEYFISHLIDPTDLLQHHILKNFPGVSDLLPEASKLQHHIKLYSKLAFY
jgi:hypothetical protein